MFSPRARLWISISQQHPLPFSHPPPALLLVPSCSTQGLGGWGFQWRAACVGPRWPGSLLAKKVASSCAIERPATFVSCGFLLAVVVAL
eukprot:scaffold114760_cov29-Tisochrysis_lutea.AAC.1